MCEAKIRIYVNRVVKIKKIKYFLDFNKLNLKNKNITIKYNNELSSRVRGKKKLVNKDINDITIAPLMIILE